MATLDAIQQKVRSRDPNQVEFLQVSNVVAEVIPIYCFVGQYHT